MRTYVNIRDLVYIYIYLYVMFLISQITHRSKLYMCANRFFVRIIIINIGYENKIINVELLIIKPNFWNRKKTKNSSLFLEQI